MASYSVVIKRSAAKELQDVPRKDRGRIIERIQGLASEPRPVGAEKLAGNDKYRAKDSVRFALQRCSGQVRFHVIDQLGTPVVGAKAVLYTSTEVVANAVTAADGSGVIPAPCLTPLGTIIAPPPGYTVPDGRGSQFFDGFSIASGGAIDFTFVLRKVP